MSGASLRIEGVTKRFGGLVAVDDVSVSIEPGGALGIIGPNGAGKSTVMRMVAGVHKPDEGRIWLGEHRLDRLPEHRVSRLGVAFAHQIPRPFPQLTVRENVRVGAVSDRRAGATSVDEILELCELDAKAAAPAAMLRVLDLKRLEIARALATSPRLLMLDEVAAGLVGRELDAAIELIQRIRAQGLTVMLVEHVERVVREIVDEVIVLDWGCEIARGTPAEIAVDEHVRAVYLGDGSRVPAQRATTTRAATDTVVDLDGVSSGYGQLLALRDVTVQVRDGEVVTVLGANGAGKSTLCGTIAGTVGVRGGTVRCFGDDVGKLAVHERSRLGIASCQEGRKIFADMTVAENLAIGAGLGVDRSTVADRLEKVTTYFPILRDRLDQRGGTMSGGQQQMLAIARALMADPKLLICDEISLGLAPIIVDDLYGILARINAEGVALLLIEQNVHRCLGLADHAYVLARGQVTYDGPPDALADSSRLDEAYFGATSTAAGGHP
ncbi:MAG: ATP-binding cassette domain-containing protein [Acidimicrobiales bacterium]